MHAALSLHRYRKKKAVYQEAVTVYHQRIQHIEKAIKHHEEAGMPCGQWQDLLYNVSYGCGFAESLLKQRNWGQSGYQNSFRELESIAHEVSDAFKNVRKQPQSPSMHRNLGYSLGHIMWRGEGCKLLDFDNYLDMIGSCQ